jgi:site-specific recombinase XerD
MSNSESIELAVERFLVHKRALGRKYLSEQAELRLLVAFASEHGVVWLAELTPALLDDFLGSRPRSRPRSFNHLLGVVACLLDWAVAQQLLVVSPFRARRRRVTSDRIPFLLDAAQARRLLNAAGALPGNARTRQRGATYRTIFALCYGLGLRAGEACGLRIGDIDTGRDLLVVRGGKFGKSRLVPHGPRIAALVGEQLDRGRRDGAVSGDAPLFTFDGSRQHPPAQRQPDVPPTRRHARSAPTGRGLATTAAQPAAQLRGRMPVALVSRGTQSSSQGAPALDIHGARRPVLDRRLLDDHPGALGRGQPPVRDLRGAGVDGDATMSPKAPLGPLLHSFFLDHLITVKGLRPSSVRSYRDTIRLLLLFIAADKRSKITRLAVGDLTFERIVAFLRRLEQDRGNHIRTRNQRLAAIHTLFEYTASRSPEMLIVCQQVAAIPTERVPPPETRFLELDEIQQLLQGLPSRGRHALRDRSLILFLYKHRRPRPRSSRPAHRAPRPLSTPNRPPSRQGLGGNRLES